MPTSPMARTTNSALIICATIWNTIRPDCASGHSILPSSTRSIPSSSTKHARRSSFPRRRLSPKIYTLFLPAWFLLSKKTRIISSEEKHRTVTLTPAGIEKAEKKLGIDNIYTDKGIKYVHHLETAVKAKALYRLNKEYVVKDNDIVIVDEFTGRLQPGRRWSEGLHQAIEAKEGVAVQHESRTFASITFQNYFRLYKKLPA